MKSNIERRLRITFWIVAILLGALQAWGSRHTMDSDGISYLDHGDAFFRGEWRIAVNAYWSPLYSWLLGLGLFLLKPAPYWEYSVAHLVNFLIYLAALGSFDFLLRELVRQQELRQERLVPEGLVSFPPWTCQVLAYTLFIWSSLALITIREVTPDLAVAALVYLTVGILLRIRSGRTDWILFIFLGLVLGIGYLTKSPMFLLSFVFLSTCLFSLGPLKTALPRTVVAFATFLLVASPYILAISETTGRLTFGESGRFHYFWYINQDRWFSYSGVKKIFHFPPVYEFGTPVQGTYPIWFDPVYWNKNVIPDYFHLNDLIRVLLRYGVKGYCAIFFSQQGYFTACLFLLLFLSRRPWFGIKEMGENWVLLLPAGAALAMYSFLDPHLRYLGPFIALLWLGTFSGVRLPDFGESRRLLVGVTLVLAMMMFTQLAREEIPLVRTTVRELVRGEEPSAHLPWLVARHLDQMGLKAGDPVAAIGSYYHAFWARLARVRIVAEIPYTDSSSFWAVAPEVRSQVINAFASTGAKVMVAERVPPTASTEGWQRVENTDFFVRPLST